MSKPVVLCILDGCGVREESDGNAFLNAYTPTLDMLMDKYPHSILEASGPAVGLPEGQMGTSEVGHMNIGAGRIALQPLENINKSINDKTFFSNNQRNLAWKISFITSWNNFTQFCNIFFGFLEYIFNNYKDINKYKDSDRDMSVKSEIWTGIIISLLNGNKNNRIPKLNVNSLFTCSNDIEKIILWIKKNNRVTSTKYILTNLSEEDKQEIINRTTYLYFGYIMEPEIFKFVTEKPKLDNIICLNDDEYIKCYDPMDFVNKKYTIEKI